MLWHKHRVLFKRTNCKRPHWKSVCIRDENQIHAHSKVLHTFIHIFIEIFHQIRLNLVVRKRLFMCFFLLHLKRRLLFCLLLTVQYQYDETVENACAKQSLGFWYKCETLIHLLFMCINEQEAKAHKKPLMNWERRE